MTACLAGERCRDFDRTTQLAADAGDTPLCEPCLTQAGRGVDLLAHDWRDLEQLLPPSLGQWGERDRGRSMDPPVPMRLDVEELQRRIWWLATAWAEVLADRHRLADPPRGRDGPMVVWAVAVLSPRVQLLARLGAVQLVNYPQPVEDTTRFGTRAPAILGNYPRTVALSYVTGALGLLHLSSAHQRARSMLGLTEPVYELPGHCQAKGCGRAELRVKDGSDTVWCDRCGAQMTRDDYDRYGNLFLREAA